MKKGFFFNIEYFFCFCFCFSLMIFPRFSSFTNDFLIPVKYHHQIFFSLCFWVLSQPLDSLIICCISDTVLTNIVYCYCGQLRSPHFGRVSQDRSCSQGDACQNSQELISACFKIDKNCKHILRNNIFFLFRFDCAAYI